MRILVGMEDDRNLSHRQAQVLEQLKKLHVPPAPHISKASLVPAPAWYRWKPAGLLLLVAAVIALPFIRLPLTQNGSHLVFSQGFQTLTLPVGKTMLVLQSPADLKIQHLQRHLLSGRLEAELLLEKGELFLEADPFLPKQILIQTPLLQARITGTQLLIGHQPEEGSRLMVLRGTVHVKTETGTWEPLPAGEELTVRTDGTSLRRVFETRFDPAFLQVKPILPDAVPTESSPADEQPNQLRRLIWHEQE